VVARPGGENAFVAATWTYSDWITYPTASTSRLARLRLHVQEVSDAIKSGSYTIRGRSVQKEELERYLETLHRREQAVAEETDRASGRRVGWTRGRARPS